jgi:hypothetical protein
MYIPQELNTPLLVGGLIAWWVSSRSKDEKVNAARLSRGTLIASGFLAGGSLFGVLGALLRFGGADMLNVEWSEAFGAHVLGYVMFVLLIIYMIWDSMHAKPE